MTITIQQLIALLPLLIVGLTVVVVMLAIAWKRCHTGVALLSVIGLNAALISLIAVAGETPTVVTSLIKVDGFSMLYTGLVLLASLATCTFAYSWLKGYPDNREEFYLLVLIATAGGLLLACSNDLATLFLGIELISLPLFGLVGYAFEQRRSLEAGIKYMLLSAGASSFLLFGMALLYAESGSLSFASLGQSLNENLLHEPVLLMGIGMMLVGIGFKLSLVPFHLWTPDVYQGAPTPVATFLATASKIAIFAVVVRLFLDAPLTTNHSVQFVLAIIAFVSILFGNLMAVSQRNIKRLLGYSSIAHIGYLLVALVAISQHQLAMETTGVYLIGYLFASIGAFGVVSLMSSPYQNSGDADSLFSYRGLFWHRPILAAVMTVMMLSLAGIPMTLGFIGKFYVLAIAVKAHQWWLLAAVIVGSAIGLYYYLRVTVSLYLAPPEQFARDTTHDWAITAGGIVVLIAAMFVFFIGLYPQPVIDIVRLATPW